MFLTYKAIFSGKAKDASFSKVEGSSLTIPGQGSDLAQIISSIVKLPPLDERTFDSPAGVEPDVRSLGVQVELDSMYRPTAVNFAEDAQVRQNARKESKEAFDAEKEEPGDDADKE